MIKKVGCIYKFHWLRGVSKKFHCIVVVGNNKALIPNFTLRSSVLSILDHQWLELCLILSFPVCRQNF